MKTWKFPAMVGLPEATWLSQPIAVRLLLHKLWCSLCSRSATDGATMSAPPQVSGTKRPFAEVLQEHLQRLYDDVLEEHNLEAEHLRNSILLLQKRPTEVLQNEAKVEWEKDLAPLEAEGLDSEWSEERQWGALNSTRALENWVERLGPGRQMEWVGGARFLFSWLWEICRNILMASYGYEHEGLTSCDTDQQIRMLNCPVGQNDLNQTIYFAIEIVMIVYTGIPVYPTNCKI